MICLGTFISPENKIMFTIFILYFSVRLQCHKTIIEVCCPRKSIATKNTTLDQGIKNARWVKYTSGIQSVQELLPHVHFDFIVDQIPRITGLVSVDLITAPTLAVFTSDRLRHLTI